MPDEAVLKIQIQGDSTGAGGGMGGGGSAGGGGGKIPWAEAVNPNDYPWALPANPPAGKSQGIRSVLNKFRGTLGGTFGKAAGVGLDITEAMVGGGAGAPGAAAVPIVGAVILALDKLKDVVVGVTKAMADFTVSFVNPDTDPSNTVKAISSFNRSVTEVIPGMKALGGVVSDTIDAMSGLMKSFDGFVERYSQYNPAIALAQAQAEMTQVFNDMRRAQQAGPALIQYIQARSEMQQAFEDAKLRFITKIEPLLVTGMQITEKFLPFIELIMDAALAIAEKIPGIGNAVDEIKRKLQEQDVDMGMAITADWLKDQGQQRFSSKSSNYAPGRRFNVEGARNTPQS